MRSSLVSVAAALLLASPLLHAQTVAARASASAAGRSAPSNVIVGFVFDSIARQGLPGATVQLVAADTNVQFGETVVADAAGHFRFERVPDGKYTIGFFHPMLDSLGLEPMLRAVSVSGARDVRADLAIPSSARVRSAICGAAAAGSGGGVTVGFVRDARTREPIADATVIAEWVELSIGAGGMKRRTPRRIVKTRESGWYAACDVPAQGIVQLMASRGADSTDLVEAQVPLEGLLRRDLYVGPAQTVVARMSSDSTALPASMHVGSTRMSGRVRANGNGKPLAGASVRIVNGPQARTNDAGEWTITDAPSGTRQLEVRAVGYYPERTVVDVVEGARPAEVYLATFQSVLDTMKVRAKFDRFVEMAGFRDRAKSGLGRFLTADDILRRQPNVTSDLFLSIGGLFVDRPGDLDTKVLMRGLFTDRCTPAIYLHGQVMNDINASDLDAFIRPSDIAGIEVYAAGQAPPQFVPGLSGCGSIVIWSK